MGMRKVTGCVNGMADIEIALRILFYLFTPDITIAFLSHDALDQRLFRLEVVADFFRIISLGTVLKNRFTGHFFGR
ncbi:hypothetical protein D3C87_1698050 [compost metagenome]